MPSESRVPDYDLPDTVEVSAPAQLSAIAHPLRSTILDLVLERAATVSELAAAVGRPHGTVSYHVNVLLDAGMLRIVRTRRVRAVEERYYGRTGRTLHIGVVRGPRRPVDTRLYQQHICCRSRVRLGARGRHSLLDGAARTNTPGERSGLLALGRSSHPRVHATTSLRRHRLRIRDRPLPHRPPHAPAGGRRAHTGMNAGRRVPHLHRFGFAKEIATMRSPSSGEVCESLPLKLADACDLPGVGG